MGRLADTDEPQKMAKKHMLYEYAMYKSSVKH